MSYAQIAKDYFESPQKYKLPQDFRSYDDYMNHLNVHKYTQGNESFFPVEADLEFIAASEWINHLTIFMLICAAIQGEI